MLDKALLTITQQSYYFQLYPLSLTIVGKDSEVPSPGTTYRFTVNKDQQKLDETKLPIQANYKKVNGVHVMVVQKSPLNFFIANFNKHKSNQFTFSMYQTENKQEYFIAEYIITIDPYVNEYKTSRTVRFQHKTKFSEDYELQFEVYLQKSRFSLEKVVKDYKVERNLKSPLRERKQQPSPPKDKKQQPQKRTLTQTAPIKHTSETSEPNTQLLRNDSENTSTFNKKVEALDRSNKEDSKVSSRKGSEVHPAKVEEKLLKYTPRTENQTQQEQGDKKEHITKGQSKFSKKSNDKFQNADSEKSPKLGAPVIEVKYKALSKGDAPSQIKMTGSQRLPQSGSTIEQPKKEAQSKGSQKKENILLTIFLIISGILIFFAMSPNRKV